MKRTLTINAVRPISAIAPGAIVILSLIVLWGCRYGDFRYDGSSLNVLFAAAIFLCGYGFIISVLNNGSCIGRSVTALGMFGALSFLATLATAVMAQGQFDYVDAALASADRLILMGHDWPSIVLRLARYPWVLTLLSNAYTSLNWQPLLLFIVMASTRVRADVTAFMASWSLGLLGCILPFHWLPARGAYMYFGITFKTMKGLLVHLPWEYPLALEAVRTGSMRTLGSSSLVGLVTVPSFHACAAVFLGWGFGKVRVLRWPFYLLNGAMLISAIPVGGHYVTDVITGSLVALIAITIVNHSREATVDLSTLGLQIVRMPSAAQI